MNQDKKEYLGKSDKKGLVQVFTGNGKGKTTAALGTVLRAAGHGFKILVIFFIKGNSSDGELHTPSPNSPM